jgi:hypothetical protein
MKQGRAASVVLLVFLVLSIGVFGAKPASADLIVAPVSGVIDVGGPGFGSINDTFNRNGLNIPYIPGVTDFDAYMALNPIHSLVFAGNEWFSNDGTTNATVTYNLGQVRNINRLALWNEDASGIGVLNLFYSINGLVFLPLALNLMPPNNPINVNYPATVFAFAPVDAVFVRFVMSGCPQPDPGAFSACAIGEVAFAAAQVPEPATLALFGLGIAGVAWRSRRNSSAK